MKVFEEKFNNKPGLDIGIKRIYFDHGLFDNYKLLAIQNDAYWHFNDNDPLILPKLYVALDYLTGPSDTLYDDWKGAYAFCFQLIVNKKGRFSEYFYRITQYRSYIDFSFQQLVSKFDKRESSAYHQPDDELFSNEDICCFSQYFCDFAIANLESSSYKPKPFVTGAESNALLFGYKEGEYFIEDHDSLDEYHNRKQQLEELIAV